MNDSDLWQDIRDFHVKYGIEFPEKSQMLNKETDMFRTQFLLEEFMEYARAKTLEDKIDALVDLVYVAMGTAYMHGFDFPKHWDEVQQANMCKVRAESANNSKRKTQLDIVKPEGWKGPEHKQYLR